MPPYMYINVESGEMDQLYKGEIVLCYIFLDVLPLISQEIEKRTSSPSRDYREKASIYFEPILGCLFKQSFIN